MKNDNKGLTRRRLCQAAPGALLAACQSSLPDGPAARSNKRVDTSRQVVLVPGTWHGAWCWRDFSIQWSLDSSHRLWPLDLAGLGERKDELESGVHLNDHVDDVVSLLDREELSNVILVGHSYGGMVITGAASRRIDRIRGLVYLDAVVPAPGQSMLTCGPARDASARAEYEAAVRSLAPDGELMQPLPPVALGVAAEHPSYDWLASNLSPHPLQTWLDPLEFGEGDPAQLAKLYIHCTNPVLQPSDIPWFADRARQSGAWSYRELATGHEAMVTKPAELADLVLSWVSELA